MKIHFISLGCPRNLVDTEVMLGIVSKHGFIFTETIAQANYIVVNTCGFLKIARQEACEVLEEVFEHKRDDAKVIVAGCMVKNYQSELSDKFPDIHYFIGSGNVDSILKAILDKNSGECVSGSSYLQKREDERILTTPGHYAYLKVAEGCLKRCTYCSIPTIKGPLKSRTINDIEHEFKRLLDQGVFEVILIAQDLGDFGKDSGDVNENVKNLIKRLLQDPREFWLRLMYIYPDEIDDELIDLIDSDDRICNYIDMPIQHVDDDILRRMGRKTNRNDIENTIDKLRNKIPDIVIRTSLITGFPGETKEQHEALKDFIVRQKLDNIGVFKYSQEDHTVAANFDDQISEEEKEYRYSDLMETQQGIALAINNSMIGYQIPVIVDSVASGEIIARSYAQCPEIDSNIIINSIDINNEIINNLFSGCICLVEIESIKGYDLIANLLKTFEE